MPPLTGRVIAGRYALSAPIGRGAMGVVWRGHDQLLDREVAVKEVVLSGPIGEDERRNAYQRTLREARTAARLSHRGVVTVYDVAEEDGRPWIVMELVPSRSLDQLVAAEGPMTALRAGRMGQQLLAALAAAHAAGVLHRDVKPSNVLIAVDRSSDWDERAVLTDFGIAQFEGDPRLTQTGMVMGSPGFTAPERIRGGDATPASDLWSLGATIYTAVEGRGPYEQRGGAITTMSAIINEDAPVAPSAGRLAPLIAALLRREPSARPSASAAARMFAGVLPLLADGPAHPATVRSAHVPAPPAPAAVEAAEAAQAAEGAAAICLADASDSDDTGKRTPQDEEANEAEDAAGAAGGAGAAAPVRGAGGDEVAPVDVAASIAPAAPPAAAAVLVTPAAAPPSEAAPPGGAVSATDSKLASAPGPAQRPVQLPPPVPAQPKPTFTASKAAEHAAPSFSALPPAPAAPPAPPNPAARPAAAKNVPPQPAPSFSAGRPARPADPPTLPEPAQASAQYSGSGAPPAGPGNEHGSPIAHYPGPAQAHPDLARPCAPGASAPADPPPRRRRGRMIGLAVAAVVVAAAAGAGAAIALHHANNAPRTSDTTTTTTNTATVQSLPKSVQALDSPSNRLPAAGWRPVTIPPSAAGTAAGFTIDIPPGWTETRDGLSTDFTDSNGKRFFEVDLTEHTYANMVPEARYVERNSVAAGDFPHYKRAALEGVPVRGAAGAFWQFTFIPSAGVTLRADDIFFTGPTASGSQSYAIFFQAPDSGWDDYSLPQFEKMLRTFQIVQS